VESANRDSSISPIRARDDQWTNVRERNSDRSVTGELELKNTADHTNGRAIGRGCELFRFLPTASQQWDCGEEKSWGAKKIESHKNNAIAERRKRTKDKSLTSQGS